MEFQHHRYCGGLSFLRVEAIMALHLVTMPTKNMWKKRNQLSFNKYFVNSQRHTSRSCPSGLARSGGVAGKMVKREGPRTLKLKRYEKENRCANVVDHGRDRICVLC